MIFNINEIASELDILPISNDTLRQLTYILNEQTSESLPSFVSQSFQSLLNIEYWAWRILSKDYREWTNESNYYDLFQALTSFNTKLAINDNNITIETKGILLIPHSIEWIDGIFDQIDTSDDTFLSIISLWFITLSHFVHEYSQFVSSPVIAHINYRIARNILMTEQYKIYLNQLREPHPSQLIFTIKQLFYLRTCSLSLSAYLSPIPQKFIYTGEQIIKYLADDYIQIILVHSYTVKSWSQELLSCIASLISLISTCCWWGGEEAHHINMIVSNDLTLYDHIPALIRIISYKPFHECIDGQWPNMETILIDSIIGLLRGAVNTEKLSCFIRMTTSLPDILTSLVQTAPYDRIVLCAHGLLTEILTDEQLKELKIVKNIKRSCVDILEQAWNDPSQKYLHIPLLHILRGLANLSKNDLVQENISKLNKMPLLIEMLDRYPIVYDILWGLSFNSSIQEQLRSNHSFMIKLTDVEKNYSNEKIRKIAHGILWNLNSYHDEQIASSSEIFDGTIFDIMISYSHQDKDICKQLYDELVRNGYKVWIDFDQIHGNIMDAMAQAIEHSRTILICMSEQYRRSNYCRAEAEYAFQRQLKIIPVLLQEHYKPDGWLLFLIGQALYVDFTKYEYSTATEMLIKEVQASRIQNFHKIEVRSDQNMLSVPARNLPIVEHLSKTKVRPENIQNWTVEHVNSWLKENNLFEMSQLLSDVDGPTLIYFSEYLTKGDTQQILASLQQDSLQRTNRHLSFIELAHFRNLIRQHGISSSTNIKSLNKMNDRWRQRYRLINRCHVM
ncbi:unnamed protein product [Adineta steineri]|uniref:TIR domain-containing protein n=1 Tax=Adineta steineri TaxID=433720 RepID=A0A813TEB9_9BILA|nr:unnamed protein product [Adineta steineri]CAF3950353.1 unnamed protein product [Adineta steineri]